jgi:hypothetical protein
MLANVAYVHSVMPRTDQQTEDTQTGVMSEGGKGERCGGLCHHSAKHNYISSFVNMNFETSSSDIVFCALSCAEAWRFRQSTEFENSLNFATAQALLASAKRLDLFVRADAKWRETSEQEYLNERYIS